MTPVEKPAAGGAARQALTIAAGLAAVLLPASVLAQAAAPTAEESAVRHTVDLGNVFTYFFVMLGPLKLLAPFARMTRGMEEGAARRLALKGFGIACIGGVAAAFLGQNLLRKWGVSLPALLIAAGLVLLLVALRAVLAQYSPLPAAGSGPAEGASTAAPAAPRPGMALSPLAFPSIITPYGVAGLVLLLAASPSPSYDWAILGVFLVVMVLDLGAMWFVRPIVRHGAAVLGILGAVLGILQVALAVQLLLAAARMVGALPPSAN